LDICPELSVVMATFQRAETIKRTLKYLELQDIDPARFELIVVDDGSVDDTEEVVQKAITEKPYSITYLRHENTGPGYTQNRGIKIARGDILLLMADDIWMEPQTLGRHLDFHLRQNKGNKSALVGRVFASPEMNESAYLRNWDPHQFKSFNAIVEVPYYMFWACNVSLKRRFMLEGGMFRDSRGRAGSAAHEDPEVGYRLMQNGMKLFYDSKANGLHYHYEEFDITIDRMYQRGQNFGEFRRLVGQPELSVAYHVLNVSTLKDHWRIYRGERKEYLNATEKNPFRMTIHYVLRALVFNRITVSLIWLPFMRAAEKSTLVESLVRPRFYHGLMAYYFQKGAGDGNRKFDAIPDQA
jgi:glycosyltransferase involved in cell wall biosynthesis